MASYITTLKSNNGADEIAPRTKVKAVSDDDNVSLDTLLDAKFSSSDLSTLLTESDKPAQAKAVGDAIESLKSSVSNGKKAVASAITDKGVTTAEDATFDTMATNIESISTDPSIGDTVTSSSQILSGYTAHSNGTQYTGTFEAQTKIATPTTSDQTVSPDSGKYLSGVTVKGVSVPSAGNILTGSSVSSNGSILVSGSMANNTSSIGLTSTDSRPVFPVDAQTSGDASYWLLNNSDGVQRLSVKLNGNAGGCYPSNSVVGLKASLLGTAGTGSVLSGATFTSTNGICISGSMTNQGAKSTSLNCGGSYTIPAGYHNGSGKITANSLSSQTSATASAAQILSGYTAWVNGSKLTGTMSKGATNIVTSIESSSSSIWVYLDVSNTLSSGQSYFGVISYIASSCIFTLPFEIGYHGFYYCVAAATYTAAGTYGLGYPYYLAYASGGNDITSGGNIKCQYNPPDTGSGTNVIYFNQSSSITKVYGAFVYKHDIESGVVY